MIRHVSLLTWSDAATAEALAALERDLAALPGLIPELRHYTFGADLGAADGNADYVIIADLDDLDAWRRYQEHPAHQALLRDRIRPILATRTAAQLDLGP